MLSDRLGLSLRQAEAEIATVIQSENAADIDDILEKYARYPQSSGRRPRRYSAAQGRVAPYDDQQGGSCDGNGRPAHDRHAAAVN
jgi:hypothetical protein